MGRNKNRAEPEDQRVRTDEKRVRKEGEKLSRGVDGVEARLRALSRLV